MWAGLFNGLLAYLNDFVTIKLHRGRTNKWVLIVEIVLWQILFAHLRTHFCQINRLYVKLI